LGFFRLRLFRYWLFHVIYVALLLLIFY